MWKLRILLISGLTRRTSATVHIGVMGFRYNVARVTYDMLLPLKSLDIFNSLKSSFLGYVSGRSRYFALRGHLTWQDWSHLDFHSLCYDSSPEERSLIVPAINRWDVSVPGTLNLLKCCGRSRSESIFVLPCILVTITCSPGSRATCPPEQPKHEGILTSQRLNGMVRWLEV